MKFNIKKVLLTLLLPLSLVTISSCKESIPEDPTNDPIPPQTEKEEVTLETKSDSLYVQKVENLSDDFIMGMDASSVISLENAGVKYYDYEGNEDDVFKILAENGINYIRVRVWNDPFDENGNGYGGGNCDINTALEIGKRATKYGMKLLVNFHYSDFWADPAKQMAPKAWAHLSKSDEDVDQKAELLYQYTKESLQLLVDNNVDVGMVQIGNETNGKMAGCDVWFDIAKLMIAGSRAIREVTPDALIAVHFANPEKVTNYRDYAKKLKYYNLDYDVFASSYYPYWHGTLDNLSSLLSEIATTYNKKVMVAETSYAFTAEDTDFYGNTISDGGSVVKDYPLTIQGQANLVRNVIDTVANKTTNGIGVFYWEGTWISTGGDSYDANKLLWEKYGTGWASSYACDYDPNDAGKYYGGCAVDNQAFFDSKGKVLESLKVFSLVKNGNVIDIKADAVADTNIIMDLAVPVELPTTVDAIMSDNSRQTIPVEWKYYQITDENYNTTKFDSIDLSVFNTGGVQKYDIVGEAGGMEAHLYLSMVEYNYLLNYSFEDDENQTVIPTGWTVIENAEANEMWVEQKATDSLTGTGHYHFWADSAHSVNFDLEQEIKDLPTGKYKYSISIMGGDVASTNCYAYVKINDVLVSTQELEITSYLNWDTVTIFDIEYNSGDKIVVGIHVECEGANNGAWGKIDDALFNSQKDE